MVDVTVDAGGTSLPPARGCCSGVNGAQAMVPNDLEAAVPRPPHPDRFPDATAAEAFGCVIVPLSEGYPFAARAGLVPHCEYSEAERWAARASDEPPPPKLSAIPRATWSYYASRMEKEEKNPNPLPSAVQPPDL